MPHRHIMKIQTYTATYIATGQVIYKAQPKGNLIGELPSGSGPVSDPTSTLERIDGGDPFEYALFESPSRRRIAIRADDAQLELEIVLCYDREGAGTLKVLSNCRTLPLVIYRDDPDRELDERHLMRAAEDRLHLIDQIDLT